MILRTTILRSRRSGGADRRSAPHQQQYRFFEYWTFKEAYIKARGMGLSLPLDKFSFQYPDDHAVEIAIDPELATIPRAGSSGSSGPAGISDGDLRRAGRALNPRA